MNQEEIDTFVSLVKKIKTEGLTIPHMPKDLWYAVHSILVLPAVEVIVTRTGKDFLLNYRDDEHFRGWEIPGGFISYKESLAEACLRIAKKEVNLNPEFQKVITAEVWKDHPYSSAISIVCLCTVTAEPSVGKFFTEIPSEMVSHHHTDFLKAFLNLNKNFAGI